MTELNEERSRLLNEAQMVTDILQHGFCCVYIVPGRSSVCGICTQIGYCSIAASQNKGGRRGVE